MDELLTLYRNNKWVRYIVNLVGICLLGLFILLTIYFVYNRELIAGLNGSFVSFACLFGYGTLKFLTNKGTFDSMSYGFSNMVYAWQKGAPIKYKDLIDYKDQHAPKREKKKWEFVLWYIASGVYLVVTIILYICFNIYLAGLE